jgi:hypothetical protein
VQLFALRLTVMRFMSSAAATDDLNSYLVRSKAATFFFGGMGDSMTGGTSRASLSASLRCLVLRLKMI